MKKLWQTYLKRREERRQQRFESWGKRRAKGYPRFVFNLTFIYGTWMVVATFITDCYWDGDFNWWGLPAKVLKYFIIGFIIGAVIW